MFKIVSFNYKRSIKLWYVYLIAAFFSYGWIFIDIGNLISNSWLDVSEITLIIRINYLSIGNTIILLFYILYLYKDYKSGLWNHFISLNVKSNKIIFSYLLNGFIISFVNILINFIWVMSAYSTSISRYGCLNLINDSLFVSITYLFLLVTILFICFRFFHKYKDIVIFLTSSLLIYLAIIAQLTVGPIMQIENNALLIIISLIPILNISIMNSINNFFWVALAMNYFIIILLLTIWKIKEGKNSMKINVNKNISDNFTLKIENLEINENEIIAIMGANDSWKTSFLELLSNTYKSKKAIHLDKEYSYTILKQKSDFVNVSLLNIVELFTSLSKTIKNISLEELLKEYKLINYKKTSYSKLSEEQKQRFKFMLIEFMQTDVLILDETFNFLDNAWKKKLLNKVIEMSKNFKIVFIIDHDLEIIKKICTRLIYFREGKIVKDTNNLNSIKQSDIDEILT
ncbi:ATP-binding cassette domain-containing protein [Spiroplasma floricola]|uniref:ABC transporter domain-containing protein n=1 Tax=Spiroplasma floricola 23-6 TaxID=1336749 RepID=A0A2K8SD14_9MOLU|nr:ATP-binding cassette domain-containing protein [Spiroplasma floricola]AUB31323.1 hypothetical protein SFLOR_v1c02660 [Spiroplasma floricola 23-6]